MLLVGVASETMAIVMHRGLGAMKLHAMSMIVHNFGL